MGATMYGKVMNNPDTDRIDNYYAEAGEIKTQTRDYIMSLKDKGESQNLINSYLGRLDSLSDYEIIVNSDKYRFSDRNQINNVNFPYDTCEPTSVSNALSNRGVENPVAALGVQFEDHLYNLIKNDPALNQGNVPWEVPEIEKNMINKYFGDQVKAVMHSGWNPNDSASIGTINMNTKMQAIGHFINSGDQVIMGTQLTGPGGHIVTANSVTETGVFITDSAGTFEAGYGSHNYHWNSADSSYTTGYYNFLSDDVVRDYGVAKHWYMTIGPADAK